MALPRIIVANDDQSFGPFLKETAVKARYDATHVDSGKSLLKAQQDNPADIIITDIVMPDMDDFEIINQLGAQNCKAGIILVSGHDRSFTQMAEKFCRAMGLNVLAAFSRPVRLFQLIEVLENNRTTIMNGTVSKAV
jgi:DNA-binding NtrC family response regulator